MDRIDRIFQENKIGSKNYVHPENPFSGLLAIQIIKAHA
jgi:hypothetical protein